MRRGCRFLIRVLFRRYIFGEETTTILVGIIEGRVTISIALVPLHRRKLIPPAASLITHHLILLKIVLYPREIQSELRFAGANHSLHVVTVAILEILATSSGQLLHIL